MTTGTSTLRPVAHEADPELWEMHWTTECTIDPAGVDEISGALEPGAWQVCLRLNVGGWLSSPRLSGLKLSVPGAPRPARAERHPSAPRPRPHPLHGVAKVAVPVLRRVLPAAAYRALRDGYRRLIAVDRRPAPVAATLEELRRAKHAGAQTLDVSSTRRVSVSSTRRT